MKNLAIWALGLLLVAGAASCSDDDDKSEPTVSPRTKLLTGKKWRINAVTVNASVLGQNIDTDGYQLIPACEKDNSLLFKTDKTAVSDGSTVKCKSDEPQTVNGTWAFDAAEERLSVLVPSSSGSAAISIDAEVVKISETVLQLRTVSSFSQSGITVSTTRTTTYAPE